VAQGEEEFSDAEVARVTLRLDALVTARRQAKAAWLATHALPVAHLPTRPGRLELAVLTALAQVYGAALVQDSHFLPVLDAIASRGGVALVQRALWGEQSEDVRLAALLLDARIAFEVLCGTWPEVFMAQALAELHRFRPQSPGSSAGIEHGGGDDD
jgi:hypothetical protein